jgi:hypothetical protein
LRQLVETGQVMAIPVDFSRVELTVQHVVAMSLEILDQNGDVRILWAISDFVLFFVIFYFLRRGRAAITGP